MNRIRWYGPSLVLLITILAVLIGGPIAVQQIAWAQTDARIKQVQNQLVNNPALEELSHSFRKVAQVVEPSVVSVEVLSRSQPVTRRAPEDLFRRFFGPDWQQQFGPFFEQPNPRQRGGQQQPDQNNDYQKYNPARPIGNGSGWVYDDQGHIITNNHVVEHADAIRVTFHDGSKYDATVVGTDPSTDVAVIQVKGNHNLHPAAVAGSDQRVQTGDMVFAFGSPFGFEFSMSQGIVSATGRQLHIIGPGGYENYIQTDAAINPGNSGGPLTNIYGEVVGMNSAIATRSGASDGLGFAIPIGMVTQVADQLIKSGKVTRGYLGVYIRDLTPDLAQTYNFKGKGVLVLGPTEPGSPADKAGVKRNDIITKVNGQDVESSEKLRYLIAGLKPDSKVKLEVFRNGKTQNLTVTLGTLPSGGTLAQGGTSTENQGQSTQGADHGMETLHRFGIESVQPFTQEMAQQLNVPFQPGVMVRAVRQGSAADQKGMDRGTVILDVQGQPVHNVDELVAQVQKYDPSKGIRLGVQVWDPRTNRYLPSVVLLKLPKPVQ